MLKEIFIRTGRFPSEIMSRPEGERQFLFASIRQQIEQEIKESGGDKT